jgi:hypothetical protein
MFASLLRARAALLYREEIRVIVLTTYTNSSNTLAIPHYPRNLKQVLLPTVMPFMLYKQARLKDILSRRPLNNL